LSAAAGAPKPFPWAAAMTAGFGLLRLSPASFWAMTPRELGYATGALFPAPGPAPGRHDVEALMRRFPDEETRTWTRT